MLNDNINIRRPLILDNILREAESIGFTMSCDVLTGNLLRSIVSTKPKGKILELGTGVGVSTCWILEGMGEESTLVTVEKEEGLHNIARKYLSDDSRVDFITIDGREYIEKSLNERFDIIFADTWPGKFYLLDEVLSMLNPGGLYIIDDLTLVETWPEEHKAKVKALIGYLEGRDDLRITKMCWSTGLILVTRKPW